MCGRYTLHLADLSKLVSVLGVRHVRVPAWAPRYNIAPTQLAPVVLRRGRGGTGERSLELLRFGLVPGYARREAAARGRKTPETLVNARVETVARLGAFKAAFQRRRCIVPATGFFEWQEVAGRKQKQPMWIHPARGELLTFAAIYEPGVDEHGEVVDTFAIITAAPTDQLRPIHDRMPLVLDDDAVERWLDDAVPSAELLERLAGAVGGVALRIQPVSSAVSSPKNDDPRCIEPVTPDAATGESALVAAQLDLFGADDGARVLTSAKRRAH